MYMRVHACTCICVNAFFSFHDQQREAALAPSYKHTARCFCRSAYNLIINIIYKRHMCLCTRYYLRKDALRDL